MNKSAPDRHRTPSVEREERLGQIWGIVFVSFILILTIVLAGKGCFGGG